MRRFKIMLLFAIIGCVVCNTSNNNTSQQDLSANATNATNVVNKNATSNATNHTNNATISTNATSNVTILTTIATNITSNTTSNATVSPTPQPRTLSPEQIEFQRIAKEALYIEFILRGISHMFTGISFFLLITLKTPFSSKFFIHKNFLASYLFSGMLHFLNHDDVLFLLMRNRTGCVVNSVFNYYANFAVFCWMACEGINICIKLHSVFDNMSKAKTRLLYLFLGWGVPGIITAAGCGIFYEQISTVSRCGAIPDIYYIDENGQKATKYYSWVYKGPISLILGVNMFCFVLILFVVIKSVTDKKRQNSKVKSLATTIRSVFAIYPILGFTFVLGFFLHNVTIIKIFPYVNGAPGIVFFVFHVLLDDQVRQAFIEQVFSRQTANKILKSKSKNTKSTTSSKSISVRSNKSEGSKASGEENMGYDDDKKVEEVKESHQLYSSNHLEVGGESRKKQQVRFSPSPEESKKEDDKF